MDVTRTPDEIKKGLECCARGNCTVCSYFRNCVAKNVDALDLIQQLQAENAEKDARIQQLQKDKADLLEERELNDFLRDKVKQLQAERDAAVACIPKVCEYCENNVPLNKLGQTGCAIDSVFPDGCHNGNTRWEWRGVQKEVEHP